MILDMKFPTNIQRIGLMVFCFLLLPIAQGFSQPFAAAKSKWLGNVYGNIAPAPHWDLYWNQVTPENSGKWQYCENNRDDETWGGADVAYNFAKTRNIPFRWHTLVWGQQYPGWIDALPDSEKAQEVEEWIKHVGERYPDCDFVDVVNEPLTGHAPATYRNALGGNGTTGWDWVVWTFQKARQYMPKAKLFINDYNILNNNGSTDTYKRLIDTLKARNLIDGIGIQGHRFEIESAPLSQLKSNLDKLGSTGLPIHITEFDLGNILNQGAVNDSVQLSLYKQRFSLLWEHPSVKGITIWGYIEGQVWQATTYLRRVSGAERPALQWLRKYVVAPPTPTLISPTKYATGVPRNPKLVWSSTETATQYGIQVAADSLFTTIILDVGEFPDTSQKLFPLDPNKKYFWRISAANNRDTSEYSAFSSFTTGDYLSDVQELENIPARFMLSQNFPNPFNPVTHIKYVIPYNSYVKLNVYNQIGQEVATLFEGNRQQGNYEVTFDGSGLTSGVYFYKLQTNTGHVQTRKLVLLK